MRRNGSRETGAALVLAAAAGAVVMLSVMLLLGYLGRMIDEQENLELEAQAALSAGSASDWLEQNLADRAGSMDDLDGASIETAGFETRIELLGSSTVPPISIPVLQPSDGDFSLVSSDGGIILIERLDQSISAVSIDTETGDSTMLPIELPLPEDGWAALGTGPSSGYAFAVIEDSIPAAVHFVSPDGSVISIHTGQPVSGPDQAEAGLLHGVPAVILYSDSCPSVAVLSDGSVHTGARAVEDALALECAGSPAYPAGVDILRADLDMDGRSDIALIGSRLVTAFLSSGRVLTDSSTGMRPAAWGLSGISGSLLVRWDGPAGRNWRRLGWPGFQDHTPSALLASVEWEGRFFEGANAVTGNSSGLVTAGGISGHSERISLLEPVFIDLDGGSPDALLHEKNGWSIVLNPLRGEGSGTSWRLSTGLPGAPMRVDTLRFSTFLDEAGDLSVRREEA